MASKTLTYEECELFYTLRDMLAAKAHEWLGIGGSLNPNPDAPDLFDEDLLCETLDQALATPDIVERFVRENPFGVSAEGLAVVAAWNKPITGNFIVFKHAGQLLMLSDGRLFHVSGLLDPIEDILDEELPLVGHTTLLPFLDRIVHYGFIMSYPVQMADGFRRMMTSEISDALRNAEHVVDAEDFVEVAPLVAEERIRREADQMIQDLELEMKAGEQLPGHHTGALAGMSPDQRKAAVREYAGRLLDDHEPFDAVGELKKGCAKGPVRTDLASLIATETKRTLQSWASAYGLPHASSLSKDRLVESLVPVLSKDELIVTIGLQKMTSAELDNYRVLFEADGVRRVSAKGLTTLKGLPPVIALMCYLFFDGDTFTFVIPDKVKRLLRKVDWAGCESTVRDLERAADVVDALTSLRGIVTETSAYDEFRRCYPDAFGEPDFRTGVIRAVETGYAGYDILDTGDGVYFAHYDIGDMFCRENGIAGDDRDALVLEGDLGHIGTILMHQEGKHPRGLEEGMRDSAAVYDWRENRPAVTALRNYLDAHVPDDADDYLFADAAIEDLVNFMSHGMTGADTVRVYFEILEDHGLQLNEAHMRKVMELLMNMANAMPTWLNNGWAPDELHGASTGQKVFYNEDGTVRKVGRNEPCPCGSGKKYKRCCGR